MWTELNIDAIVGPSHHFGGLGVGNVASQEHQFQPSNPQQAALAGLQKAMKLRELGLEQFLLPPPRRPRLDWLQRLGFDGSTEQILTSALKEAPQALSSAFSSSFMWAANAATVTPSCDASDGRFHVTPANLLSSWHRGVEARERETQFRTLFSKADWAVVHEPLPNIFPLRDEGAANHMRLCDSSGAKGFNLFVYGNEKDASAGSFLPRQTQATCEALARLHQLNPETTFILQQHPDAIAAGVFHNDVIAMSHLGVLIYHQQAFLGAEEDLERLSKAFKERCGVELCRIQISSQDLSLEDAVTSYLFNSQLVSTKEGGMQLICPKQCQTTTAAHHVIQSLIASPQNPIQKVHFVDLNESMANGGGPACVRLRMSLTEEQLAGLDHRFRLDEELYDRLRRAIEASYPTEVTLPQLAEPGFLEQIEAATDAVYAAMQYSA